MRARPDPRDRLAPLRRGSVRSSTGPTGPTGAAGFGGWVPEVTAASDPESAADELLARWAPPPPVRGRHRGAEPEPDEADPDPTVSADVEQSVRVREGPPAVVDEPAEHAPDPPDPAAGDGPGAPRRHRIGGRWGRFAELWVPEPLRNARLDPGRRGMVVLVLVAAVAAVATAVGVWRDRPEPRPIETSVVAAVSEVSASPGGTDGAPAAGSTAAPPAGEILVSVTGLVAHPGVVRLPVDARVADAITAAGGAQAGANLTGMNLAARLADGDSVVVGETPTTAGPAPGPTAPAADGSATPPAGLVNLNTADEAALDTLPGVGPVMAQNIIAWRESNGKFTSVEQLQEISGIGPARYAQISGLVAVG